MGQRNAFTMVEILIVVIILGILAMVVIPRFASSSDDARDAALSTDLKTVRRQIELYKLQHANTGPEVNERGQFDLTNLVNRMTGRTTPAGALDPAGACGPYLTQWPENPYVDSSVARTIKFGKTAPPRDNSTGWYFNILTREIHVNSSEGAESVDPSAAGDVSAERSG